MNYKCLARYITPDKVQKYQSRRYHSKRYYVPHMVGMPEDKGVLAEDTTVCRGDYGDRDSRIEGGKRRGWERSKWRNVNIISVFSLLLW